MRQNAPPVPRPNSQAAVNFNNLDNLLSDLNNIATTNSSGDPASQETFDKVRLEYEKTIKSLQHRNAELEAELTKANTTLFELNGKNSNFMQVKSCFLI